MRIGRTVCILTRPPGRPAVLSWRPSCGLDALVCGGCGAVMLPPGTRAIGSAGERLVHTEEVTGSIPVSPTSRPCLLVGLWPTAPWAAIPSGGRAPGPRNWWLRFGFSASTSKSRAPGPPQLVVAVGSFSFSWESVPVAAIGGCGWGVQFLHRVRLKRSADCVGAVVLARGALTPGAPAIHGTGCSSASAGVSHPACGALRANRRALLYAQASSKPPGAPDPAASPAVVEQYRSLIIRTLSYPPRMTSGLDCG